MNSSNNKQWIVKDSDGRITGPFSLEVILDKITYGELGGEEKIALYPNGDWYAISQEPQFYDQLLDALAKKSVYEENFFESKKSKKESFDDQDLNLINNNLESEDESEEGSGWEVKSSSIKTSQPRGRVKKRVENKSSDTYLNEEKNSNIKNSKTKKEENKRNKNNKSKVIKDNSVIELKNLSKEVKKRKVKSIILPLLVGLALIFLFLMIPNKKKNSTTRTHLIQIKLNLPPKPVSATKITEAQVQFTKGNYFELIKAQNNLVSIVESQIKNSSMLALLCMTYFELWPYAYQDSSDLKAVSLATQAASLSDPAGLNASTCQTIDLILRGRFQEAKSLTETMLDKYSASSTPPIPFYYLKAYLLEGDGDGKTAIGYLQSTQQLAPQWTSPFYMEALIRIRQNQYLEGAKVLRKVIEMNPRHVSAKLELGTLEIRSFSHAERGVQLINEALSQKELTTNLTFSKAYFALATVAVNQKNTSKALEMAQKSYENNPSNLEAKNLILALGGKEKLVKTRGNSQQLVYEGDQFVREGDCNGGQAHYKTAYEMDSSNATAAFKAAQCLWTLSFSREAIEWLNKSIKADPKFLEAYVLLADYFTQRYDFLSAARVLAQAQKIAPKSYEVYRGYAMVELRRNNPNGAIGYANKALGYYETDVESHIIIAKAYLSKGDATEAYKHAAKSIEIDVNNQQGQVIYAQTIAATRGAELGLDYLLKLVSSYPLVSEYRMALGEMYLADEQYQKAIDVFIQITEIENKPKKALLMLGKTLRLSGQKKEALEALLKSAVLDPGDSEPLFEAGLLYLEINKPADAIVQFERVLRINNRHPNAHYYIGKAALDMNNPKLALEHAEEERKINPNLADPYMLSAEAYYQMNQHSLCVREYTQAIKLRPQGAETYVKLAKCYRLMSNLDMAESMLNQATKYNSGLPDIYKELGELYIAKENLPMAAEAFNQYFQLNPGALDRAQIENRLGEIIRSNR